MDTSVQEIHRSVADADDLESVSDKPISVGDVFANLFGHPLQVLTRWNWKAALLGAIFRASFYVAIYKASRESWIATLTAASVELAFRLLTSGISGALVQSFRRARPAWLAMAIISVSLPIFSHTIEFFTHYIQEAYFSNIFVPSSFGSRRKAIAISVLVSVVSGLFNIFMMRNGVLLVGAGEETKTLRDDMKMIPRLVYEFTLFLPNQIIEFVKNGKILYALGSFLAFGLVVGTILGTLRGKWSWGYSTALGAWGILSGFILLVLIGQFIYNKMVKT